MKKRVISAIVALIIVIPLLIIGGVWFNLGVGIIGLIGFDELLKTKSRTKKVPKVMRVTSTISFVLLMMSSLFHNGSFFVDYRLLIITILVTLLPLLVYDRKNYDSDDALFLLGSIVFLGLGFNFLMTIREKSIYYIFYLLMITIMTDTFAHFFGTKIGNKKLCPNVSPNKTVEGFVGGTIFGTFIGTIFYITFISYSSLYMIIVATLLMSLMGSFGDLIFSAIKRTHDVKDFGNIMPGHGGVLDRLDSLLIVILTFSLVYIYL